MWVDQRKTLHGYENRVMPMVVCITTSLFFIIRKKKHSTFWLFYSTRKGWNHLPGTFWKSPSLTGHHFSWVYPHGSSLAQMATPSQWTFCPKVSSAEYLFWDTVSNTQYWFSGLTMEIIVQGYPSKQFLSDFQLG